MRSKDQLNPDEEDETREIASVRIHVGRANERVKNFNILKQILPNSMAEDVDKFAKFALYWLISRGLDYTTSGPLKLASKQQTFQILSTSSSF